MKALRRSIKGEKNEPKNSHVSITPKSALAIVPPKKVIRALYDYEAQTTQELSFSRGDFFHVIGRENDTEWYEACNPAVPDARGLVPVAFFQALGKTERDSGHSDLSKGSTKAPDHDSGYSERPGSGNPMPTDASRRASTNMAQRHKGAMVYGVVMYDFNAERPDELEAKAGEAIIVIAQSNPEWFVAKPIGRLGGPGLIPLSFIEIRDMTTGQTVVDTQDAVTRAGVPRVEEWKKMAADYKNSSITLGKFESQQQQQQSLEQGMDQMSLSPTRRPSNGQSFQQPRGDYTAGSNTQQQQQVQQASYEQRSSTQMLCPVAAQIPRYCFAEDKYWFVVDATMEDGSRWELSRYYEDFYDFQIALLTEFPAEAGNTGAQKRTLPYMPGPVNYVTDAITDGRRHNLDAYVKNLLNQPEYISKCDLVKQFFDPRDGDFEIDPNAVNEDYRLSGASQSSRESPDVHSAQSSRNNLNGGTEYPGLSAPPARQPSHRDAPSNSAPQPPNGSAPQNAAAASAMKVKIYFGDDLIAIRVPSDISYQALYDKIRDRLRIPEGEEIAMFYKDEASGERPNLLSDNDLDFALKRNDKLIIYVEYSN